MLVPDPIQKPLVVPVFQNTMTQFIGEFFTDGQSSLSVGFKRAFAFPIVVPELVGFAQSLLEVAGEGLGSAFFGFLHGTEVFEQVAETFLLFDLTHGECFITAAAVGA